MKKAKLKKKFIWKKIENGYLYGPEESQPKQEDWEKEFREFGRKHYWDWDGNPEPLFDFIRNLLAKEQKIKMGIDLDTGKVEHFDQPKQEDWEKEFDRKFPYAWIEWEKRDVLGKITEEHSDKIKEIKSFIRNLIAKEREKGYGDCLDYYGLGRNNR